MLVLSRKAGEQITIGNDVTVTVLEVRGNRIRLGIGAPSKVSIKRSEIVDRFDSSYSSSPSSLFETMGCLMAR